MKIAILTQPLHTNYGGLIQAYALQLTLKRMGHEVFTVDRRRRGQPNILIPKAKAILKRAFLRWALRRKDIPTLNPFWMTDEDRKYISRHLTDFIQHHIQMTELIQSSKEMEGLAKRLFDAYIVGSDQVWRPKYSPCLSNYFLDFLEPTDKAIRIAYAASFGTDVWEFNAQQTRRCAELAKRFNAVSVREDSAVGLCEKHLGVCAVQLVDPTLLLNAEDYRVLAKKEEVPESAGKLAVYMLDRSRQQKEAVERLASDLGLSIKDLMPEKLAWETTRKDIEKCVFPSMGAWLGGFMGAKYVITDSFHGTIFATLFRKPFLTISNKARGLTRLSSLLKRFGLEDRWVTSLEEVKKEKINKPINFENVFRVLEREKRRALKFLSDAVGISS